MARASAAFEDDFPSLLPKRSKPLLLHRSSSFRQLMNRTDTHTVDSWLTSLTSQPSLTRGSSTFSRFTTPESAGNFHWAEETVCLDLCPDDIQPMSSVFQPSTPAKPAAQKKPSLSLSIDMPATPGAKISYWVYSHLLHQFFSGLNVEYPVTLASDRPVPQGAMLTMHLEYIKEAQKSQPVVRCPQHADQDEEADLSNHVLRSSNKLATYETSPITGVNRIAVPIKLSKRGTPSHNKLQLVHECRVLDCMRRDSSGVVWCVRVRGCVCVMKSALESLWKSRWDIAADGIVKNGLLLKLHGWY
eukprot:m.73277 g.73277  ORF g.73277 m.73277 type:complete len:302 (+) comp12364_c0_seq5:138-1043(+)